MSKTTAVCAAIAIIAWSVLSGIAVYRLLEVVDAYARGQISLGEIVK
jgi:hypothetical protein